MENAREQSELDLNRGSSFFKVKSNERVFVSPIGDVFLIDTFTGKISFEFNVGVNLPNINYNKQTQQYYFIAGKNNDELFMLLKDNEIKYIDKLYEIEKYSIENVISSISINGNLYFMDKYSNQIFRKSLRMISSVEDIIKLAEYVDFSAFTHNLIDNNIYGVEKSVNKLKRVNITNGVVTNLNIIGEFCECEISIMFSDELGYVYAIDNITGNIYKISILVNEAKIEKLGDDSVLRLNQEQINIMPEAVGEEIFQIPMIEKINKIESENKKNITRKFVSSNSIVNGNLYEGREKGEYFHILCDVQNGSLNINKTNGYWSYIPNIDFNGKDNFEVILCDDNAREKLEFEICVGDETKKVPVTSLVDEQKISKYNLLNGKCISDKIKNYDGENFNYSIKEGAKRGIAQIDRDTGIWVYEPYIGVGGEDSFTILSSNKISECRIETVMINVYNPKLELKVISNRDSISFDDVIEYKIYLSNVGNIVARNVILKDLLDSELIFKKGSLMIDNIEHIHQNISFIELECVEINECKEITFTAELSDVIEEKHDILNSAVVRGEFKAYEHEEGESFRFKSNITRANIVYEDISCDDIVFKADKSVTTVDDILNFTINFTHKGNISVERCILKNLLARGTMFDNDIVNINGEDIYLDTSNYSIVLENISINQSVEIKYSLKILDSHEKILDFTPYLEFEYLVDYKKKKSEIMFNTVSVANVISSKNFAVNSEYNEVVLKVVKNDLVLESEFSKDKVSISEEFYLRFILTNNGKNSLEDVVIRCPVLEKFRIVELMMDDEIVSYNTKSNLHIGHMLSNEKKNIKLKLQAVASIKNKIDNHIDIEAKLDTDEAFGNKITCSTKFKKMVEVLNPKLSITKTINKAYVVVGEIINMKIIVANIGDTCLKDIVITDILPPDLEFIENSVYINNKEQSKASIISGIEIDSMVVGEQIEIKCQFKAIKKPEVNSFVKMKAFAIYSYVMDNGNYYNKNIESNECKIHINKVEIEMQKKSSKNFVRLNDEITYEITIINTGDIDILNVLFIDELFEGLELINRSFSIDGAVINNVDVEKGIIIGSINVASVRNISYKVKVKNTNFKLDVDTKTYLKYSYTLIDGTGGKGFNEIQSEDVGIIDIALSNFRQVNKDEYLTIPLEKPDIDEIDSISASVKITNTHLIKTSIVRSVEGQKLTGYKLMINGYISETVEYTSKSDSQGLYSASYEIEFSDYIIMPLNFNSSSRIEVEGKVENVYHKKVSKREFFNNATVLLVAKILPN
ncbi:MAG: hypothetical protein ACRC6T_00730 [Sarcina sp.]